MTVEPPDTKKMKRFLVLSTWKPTQLRDLGNLALSHAHSSLLETNMWTRLTTAWCPNQWRDFTVTLTPQSKSLQGSENAALITRNLWGDHTVTPKPLEGSFRDDPNLGGTRDDTMTPPLNLEGVTTGVRRDAQNSGQGDAQNFEKSHRDAQNPHVGSMQLVYSPPHLGTNF